MELARPQRVRLPSYSEDGRRLMFKKPVSEPAGVSERLRLHPRGDEGRRKFRTLRSKLAEDDLAEGVPYLGVGLAPYLHMQVEWPWSGLCGPS